MIFELDKDNYNFPDPKYAEPDGLLAVGGDLSLHRLIWAYYCGIFPWYDKDSPILWWSLDPRMILFLDEFRYSKSLRRVVNSGKFQVKVDTNFAEVIYACSTTQRDGQDGTWITEEMMQAYVNLHNHGIAHSFETYYEGELAGGLYGVSLGDMFAGESMFHRITDASKVAFVALVEWCRRHQFRFIDAQQPTDHLASLGARPIPRADFMNLLEKVKLDTTLNYKWRRNTVTLLIGGNQGDIPHLLLEAMGMISRRIGFITKKSLVYETEPWGFEAEQNFLNMAIQVETNCSSEEVLHLALEIEAELGRKRLGKGYASRPMDIDLIFFNNDVVNTPDLIIPHPRLQLRRFVLQPLSDIMPTYVHPILHQTVAELLAVCPDNCEVKTFFMGLK